MFSSPPSRRWGFAWRHRPPRRPRPRRNRPWSSSRRPSRRPTSDAGEQAAGVEDQPKVKVERGAGGKKVYKIEGEIVIEGKIQKPEAFYVLQKSSINYDWHELKQEFVPKILDSVTKSPF